MSQPERPNYGNMQPPPGCVATSANEHPTCPGRPTWCSGAVTYVPDPKTGGRKTRRMKCDNHVEPVIDFVKERHTNEMRRYVYGVSALCSCCRQKEADEFESERMRRNSSSGETTTRAGLSRGAR